MSIKNDKVRICAVQYWSTTAPPLKVSVPEANAATLIIKTALAS